VAANPCQKIKLYPESGRERYLTEREVHTLMEAVRESQNVDLANIIAFLLLTGARKQEVLRAQWTDVDTVHRVWRIPVTKAGKPRYVPISDGLLRLLCCLTSRKRSIWVFPNPKTGLPYVDVHRAWDNARCKAGLSEVRIHDLRHTFASYLVNKRRSLYEVQRILGHSDSKSTQRYAHLAHESLVDAANAAGLIYQNATTESEGAAAGSGGTAGGATKQASSFDPESLAGNSTADEASVDRTEASDAQAQSLTPV
jgi:integrase